MSTRKELFVEVKQKLSKLSLKNGKKVFEWIDLQKQQFENPEKNYGTIYTAALIEISTINYEALPMREKQGEAFVSIYLYLKDGFADSFEGTSDKNSGPMELDLQDNVIEALDGLEGKNFKPLMLRSEQALESPHFGIMAYKIEFSCTFFMQLKAEYKY